MSQLWSKFSDKRYQGVLRKLRLKHAMSWGALWAEGLARSFWPLATIVLAFYAFSAFDGFAFLSDELVLLVLTASGMLAVGLAIWGVYTFRIPTSDDALARIDNSLALRPLESLQDNDAFVKSDPLTQALWERHQDQAAELALNAEVKSPDLRLASRDKFGLRLVAILGALVALMFAPPLSLDRIKQIEIFTDSGTTNAVGFEVWLSPPDYTGLPTQYINQDMNEIISAPKGSEVIIRYYGESDKAELVEEVSGDDTELVESSEMLQVANFNIIQDGSIRLEYRGSILAQWDVKINADMPPVVSITEQPTRTAGGSMNMSYEAKDDYGIVGATLHMTLDLSLLDRQYGLSADPVETADILTDLPLPFTSDKREVSEVFEQDFSKHIWANLPVTITVTVTDGMEQTGQKVFSDILPGRKFYLPLAAAIAEQRRDLLWSPDNDKRVLRMLKAITYRPDNIGLEPGAYVTLRTLIRRLEKVHAIGMTQEQRNEIAEGLWFVALNLEEGDLANARERLRRAEERLSRAMEQGADQKELDALLDELRDATDDYLSMLAQEAQEQDDEMANNNAPTMDSSQIEAILKQIDQYMKSGETEKAQALLEELRRLLENLQVTKGQGQGSQGQGGEIRNLQDALREQQELADDTFESLQEQSGEMGSTTDSSRELSERQSEIQDMLGESSGSSGADTQKEDAQTNMQNAQESLEQGKLGEALDQQAEAIENLREGIRRLAEESQQQGQGADGTRSSDANGEADRDPMGREIGTGDPETQSDMLPADVYDRAQKVLEEIRRRAGESERTDQEVDYLRRLLDQF